MNIILETHEIIEFSKTVIIKEEFVLTSLDVVSLFSNIPKELVLTIRKMWRTISAYTWLYINMLRTIIRFLFKWSYFSFLGKINEQLNGPAMGNPASQIIANLVRNHLLTECLKKFYFPVSFFKLYADDTILTVRENSIDDTITVFNSDQSKLKFTCQMENNNSIKFLDVLIIRQENDQLKTNW